MNSVSVPGLVAQLRGRATLARYNYATVFVHHFSGIGYVHLHEYNDAEAVVEAKSRFEQFAQSFNVGIKHYHCDNGIFADKTYKAACAANNQSISFCGVNAHHQSGIAEKRIRDLRDSARSMLLLAKHNWPDAISTHLWGFAMNYASTIRASTLREGETRTPLQKFAQTSEPPPVNRFHTFGCPVYTLDPDLQSGNAQPNKLTDRSRVGIFLGFSREHASTVSLVLNPITGLTSPQFHVKHDDRFESTKHPIMKEAGKWQEITQIHRVRKKKNQRAPILQRELPQQEVSQRELPKINELYPLEDPQNEDPNPSAASKQGPQGTLNRGDLQTPPTVPADKEADESRAPVPTTGRDKNGTKSSLERQKQQHLQPEEVRATLHAKIKRQQVKRKSKQTPQKKSKKRKIQNGSRSTSTEDVINGDSISGNNIPEGAKAPSSTLSEGEESPEGARAPSSTLSEGEESPTPVQRSAITAATILDERRKEMKLALHTYYTSTARRIHADEIADESIASNPMAFSATLADEDTMYLHQAQKQKDWKQFSKAMGKEIQDHTEGKHWEVIERTKVPEGHKIMRGVWSMKRKRRVATGQIYKWKARLCVDGSSQEKGVNFWDTYSPVVTWESVRSLLTLAIMNKWTTRQIDFVLAFPQAKVECPMYMEIPQGCNVDGSRDTHVLELKQNLYGSRQGSKIWFDFTCKGLQKRGFKQSKTDKAVFYKGKTIFILYVDDGILIGPNAGKIDDIINSLQKDYKLTDKGDLNEYLGIKMERRKDGTRWLTQPTLIKRILKTVGVNEQRPPGKRLMRTPATKVLHKDIGGPPRRHNWDYRSVVGMLNWLTRSTRPDLIFAVSQVGRFMALPKKSHENAILRICQYLRDTQDKGMLMRPQRTGFQVYANADFAGGFVKEHTADPNTAKSRSCYFIMFNNCMIFAHSKLQTEVALSTTEAEYICLSQSIRTVLVQMRFFKEIAKRIKSFRYTKPVIKCTAFEDNKGAIELAKAPKLRPRTKHINIKYHHFREAVAHGLVNLEHVDTGEQLADIGTKPLDGPTFEYLRRLLIGW